MESSSQKADSLLSVGHSANGAWAAILSAVLFGLSTPFAKILSKSIHPLLLAGLFYLGSGIGLGLWLIVRRQLYGQKLSREASLTARDIPWLAGGLISGGIIAPVLLLIGLTTTAASTASLLLNLESVLTVLMALLIFGEDLNRRTIIGVSLIIGGGVSLSLTPLGSTMSAGYARHFGPLLVAGACLAWGIDNNLTRRISSGDPYMIAAAKGLVAGSFNLILGIILGKTLPSAISVSCSLAVGLLGYGLSIVFFVRGLRYLGTSRTAAYFALAPFMGAAASFLILGDRVTWYTAVAGTLMAIGVYLQSTEKHAHEHVHKEFAHAHGHSHDEHHRHEHAEGIPGDEPHSHEHKHKVLIHSHPHFPDIHHRHGHREDPGR